MSEVDWVCKRAHLRHLLELHPDWSEQQLADAVDYSKSSVSRWKKRFREADPRSVAVLFSYSRAPHHHPPRIAEEVKERIQEMRLAPPENLKRTPGPKALLYYLRHPMKPCGLPVIGSRVLPAPCGTFWMRRA